MQRSSRIADACARTVLHVVGRSADEVFDLVGPTVDALARSGLKQCVVVIDDPRHRHLLPRLAESAELVLIANHRNPIRQWQAMMQACHSVMSGRTLHAAHFHGLLPHLPGTDAAGTANLDVPIFYSPRGSPSPDPLWIVSALAPLFLGPWWCQRGTAAVVKVSPEIPSVQRWKLVTLVENPVGDAFLAVRRNESHRPLIVTGGREQGPRGAERFAQLAVLLCSDDLRIAFQWFGTVDDMSWALLNAAGVGVFEPGGDLQRASRLAAGWIWVAPGNTRGFPLRLAEAMAAGLPCVAMDTPRHRDVIRHGETGFLCESEREMVACIAMLVDSPGLRASVGSAARREAGRRFGASRFRDGILAAYRQHAAASLPAPAWAARVKGRGLDKSQAWPSILARKPLNRSADRSDRSHAALDSARTDRETLETAIHP